MRVRRTFQINLRDIFTHADGVPSVGKLVRCTCMQHCPGQEVGIVLQVLRDRSAYVFWSSDRAHP